MNENKRNIFLGSAGVFVVIVICLGFIYFVPDFTTGPKITLTQDEIASLSPMEKLELDKFRSVQKSGLRKTRTLIIGGIIAFLGVVAAMWRSKIMDRQVNVMEQGDVTERFTRSVDQLGARNPDGSLNLEVRLGAIYALERIAEDSARDHWPIMEILTAYVRENAPFGPVEFEASQDSSWGEPPRIDIVAILTVIGRRKRWNEEEDNKKLDLSFSNLGHMNFSGFHFEGANFQSSYLVETVFDHAHLEGTGFYKAALYNARFNESNLWGAILDHTNLQNARLPRCNLEGTSFESSNLTGAQLYETNFSGSFWKNSILENANLDRSKIQNAIFDKVDLKDCVIEDADLENTEFYRSDLSLVSFRGSDVKGVIFDGSNLEDAFLDNVKNLTPDQIKTTVINKDTKLPPDIEQSLTSEYENEDIRKTWPEDFRKVWEKRIQNNE